MRRDAGVSEERPEDRSGFCLAGQNFLSPANSPGLGLVIRASRRGYRAVIHIQAAFPLAGRVLVRADNNSACCLGFNRLHLVSPCLFTSINYGNGVPMQTQKADF